MNRILVSLSAAAMLAAATTAQCLNTSSPGTLIGTGDDTTFAGHFALGFAFPMANSTNGTYTHFRCSPNGWLALSDGTNSPSIPSGYGSVAGIMGAAGGMPRIAPFWRDLNVTVANAAGVYYDNASNPGVSCTITWVNAVDYNAPPTKSFRAELFATGEIKFSYSSGMNVVQFSPGHVAVSTGNGVVDPGQSDLSAAPVTTANATYQIFATGTFDLGGSEILFVPNGGGGYTVATTCQQFAASHTNYGSGCYTLSDSFYQRFADAAVAGPGLTGNSMTLTPAGSEYVVTWGGGSYVAPSLGAVNVFATAQDDAEAVLTPTIAFPSPTGPQAQVRVHSNGLVSWGAAAQTFPGTNNYTPTAAGFLGGANAGIYSWHDYNEAEAGSGRIKQEEVVVGADTVLLLTWDGVENYSTPTIANPSTMQMQLNLTTGVVTIVWQSIDADATSGFGSSHLVGYSPAGNASIDAGSINLATALPLTTIPLNVPAMSMSASPAPVSTAGSGTLVTYTMSNIPEAAPTSGVYLGLTIISVGQDLAGIDLGFLGMPGCNLHVTSLDLTLAFVGGTNSLTTQFQVPNGVAYGTQLFAQSAALIVPNSLPNGQNAFGAVLSNGVASFISSF